MHEIVQVLILHCALEIEYNTLTLESFPTYMFYAKFTVWLVDVFTVYHPLPKPDSHFVIMNN